MDRRIAGLPDGPFSFEPRFHPPGRHPAIQRLKQEAELLQGFRVQLVAAGMDTSTCDEALDYVLGHIAAFEECESEAKQKTLAMLERRER